MDILKINRLFAAFMAVILIGAGLLGQRIGVSTSTPYDVFHIVFGVLALVGVIAWGGRFSALFNLVFGAIDLYQAVAYSAGLFPSQLFNLTMFDTVLHWILGAGLFAAGMLGVRQATAKA